MRAPLGIKRTVETGQVKQSFSHGRSNTVVVEVKRRRILGKPGEAVFRKVGDVQKTFNVVGLQNFAILQPEK